MSDILDEIWCDGMRIDCMSREYLAATWEPLNSGSIKFIRADLDAARRRELADMARLFALRVIRDCKPDDWACAQCHPNSEVLADGFVCTWHRAESYLSSVKG